MPVVRLRMHVAIADRRQRLDGEVEKLQRTLAAGIGNRIVAEIVEAGKYGIEPDKDRGRAAEKHRPVDAHGPMVKIGPKTLVQALRLDLAVTEPDELGFSP